MMFLERFLFKSMNSTWTWNLKDNRKTHHLLFTPFYLFQRGSTPTKATESSGDGEPNRSQWLPLVSIVAPAIRKWCFYSNVPCEHRRAVEWWSVGPICIWVGFQCKCYELSVLDSPFKIRQPSKDTLLCAPYSLVNHTVWWDWDLLCVNKVGVIATYSFLYSNPNVNFIFVQWPFIWIYLPLRGAARSAWEIVFGRTQQWGGEINEWKRWETFLATLIRKYIFTYIGTITNCMGTSHFWIARIFENFL